jgi:hypothetical protein
LSESRRKRLTPIHFTKVVDVAPRLPEDQKLRDRCQRHPVGWLSLFVQLRDNSSREQIMGDRLYQQARAPQSRREVWNGLLTLMNRERVRSWAELLRCSLADAVPSP